MTLSKAKTDELGRRLKLSENRIEPCDLTLLDEYRRSFTEAYNGVFSRLKALGLSPSGRQAKSTTAIVDKLRRESIRLTQMQDIAGCRIVVEDIAAQELLVGLIKFVFKISDADVKNRREMPNHGYRAIHLIVQRKDKVIEVQVRTALQDLWAQLSERYADNFGMEVKYGLGQFDLREELLSASRVIKNLEESELFIYLSEQVRDKGDVLQRLLGQRYEERAEFLVALSPDSQSVTLETAGYKQELLDQRNSMKKEFKQMFEGLSNVENT